MVVVDSTKEKIKPIDLECTIIGEELTDTEIN